VPGKRLQGGKPEQRSVREALVAAIAAATACWLHVAEEHRQLLSANDHLIDALVAALVARATTLAMSIPIPRAMEATAAKEGWIHLPFKQPLNQFWPFATVGEPG
jgi:hypothetical protein